MGEDPKNHLVPIPCHGHRHLPLDHIAQFPIYAGLEHFQGIHNFSGQHVSVLHHPQKREFLIPNLNLLSFSLKPFPFVLLLHGLIKIPSPALFINWKAPLRSSGAFSPPDWTTPSLSACVYRSRAPALWSSLSSSSGLTPKGLCPTVSYCWGLQSWMLHSRWGLMRIAKRGRIPWTCWSHCFWCSPRYSWLSGLHY